MDFRLFKKEPIELPEDLDKIESIGVLALVNDVLRKDEKGDSIYPGIEDKEIKKGDLEKMTEGECVRASIFAASIICEVLNPESIFLIKNNNDNFRNKTWKKHAACIFKVNDMWYALSPANYNETENPEPHKPLKADSLNCLLKKLESKDGGQFSKMVYGEPAKFKKNIIPFMRNKIWSIFNHKIEGDCWIKFDLKAVEVKNLDNSLGRSIQKILE